jgi:hypothetical protein
MTKITYKRHLSEALEASHSAVNLLRDMHQQNLADIVMLLNKLETVR